MKTKALWKYYTGEIKKSYEDIQKGNIKRNIPNVLTFSRMFAPIIIIPLAIFKLHTLTIVFTILFALTDAFDGFLARRWHAVSKLGKDLDPFVDKIFAVTLLIAISLVNPYLLVLVLFEFLIALINGIETYKDNKPKTIIIGKFKTIVLSMLIVIFMINIYVDVKDYILYSFYIITIILQIFTLIGYFDIFLKNNYNRKIKYIPEEKNGKVINKLNEVLLHENDNRVDK